MSNILSCEGCWQEHEPCIIRICGEAPLSTAADRATLDKCNTVNTELAYEVWGIDVYDLERRRKKLKELGLSA